MSSTSIPGSTLEKFTNFGDLLRFLRRRVSITQLELATAVGYSDAQISRLEQNLRLPDIPTIEARFVSALALENEPKAVARLLDLAANVRREDAPAFGISPYKGLNYFDEADADLFAGREGLTDKLTERIQTLASNTTSHNRRFLAIIGASGSGKSSLVRAGVVPALRWNKTSADWTIHVFTPTAGPLQSLAAILTDSVAATATLMDDLARDPRSLQLFITRTLGPKSKSNVLLVVDQFEELFTLCRSEQERTSFIDNLLTASAETSGPTIIVLAMRADFYAHCGSYLQLREALAQQQEYIGAMNQTELQHAIEEPASRGRWELEPGLVDLLLHDVGHEPGALPLLSHALLETWQRRRGRTLTLSGYSSSGGVRGAIAETAESVFTDQFTPEQQVIARRIFLRLTELGEETVTGDTRRRAAFNELILKPEAAVTTHAVLKALADARLITTSEDSAEVAHEALIREWPTLRGWLEDNRESLRFHRHLTETSQEWSASNHDQDMLYRGARLTQVLEWAGSHSDEMNDLEREFINTSQVSTERETAEREEQRKRELETAQKLAQTEKKRAEEQTHAVGELRKRAYYLAGAFVLALTMALIALLYGAQARESAVNAQNSQRLATSRELAAASLSNLNVDPERSILLALQAISVTYSFDKSTLPEAEDALHRAVLASHAQLTLCCHTKSLVTAKYSPDGKYIATASQDGTAKIWDALTGIELKTLGEINEDNAINSLGYSPDGTRIVTGHDDHTAKIWDIASGQVILTLSGHDDFVTSVAYSPDGTYIVTTSGDNTTRIWDALTGKKLYFLSEVNSAAKDIGSITLSPDGKQYATINNDNTVTLWDFNTGLELVKFSGHTNTVNKLAFNPNGTNIATVSDDNTARIWDVASGTQELLLNLSAAGWGVAFSPDGRSLATSGVDGKAIVWDVISGKEIFNLLGHTSAILDVSFSPDGRRLLTASSDNTAKEWDITPSHELLTFVAADAPGSVLSLAYSPDGSNFVTANNDEARIWDSTTGKLFLKLIGHSSNTNSVRISPDGIRIVTTSDDKTAKIWDARTGKILLTLMGHTNRVVSAVFSPDGKQVATASDDGLGIIWDSDTGRELLTLSMNKLLTNIAFSPDGNYLATTGLPNLNDHSLRTMLWNASTGRELFALSSPGNLPLAVGFSSDGKQLALGYIDGSVKVYSISADELNATELFAPRGHSGSIKDITYSSDGKRFATASDDGTTKIWDAATGQELLTLSGYNGGINAVTFSPDGKRLATGGRDGTVRIYLLQIEDLVKLAKSRLTRGLTTDECQKYLHLKRCP